MSVNISHKSKKLDIERLIAKSSKINVLVGIPQSESSRSDDPSISNAELLYIHTHGIRQSSMRKEMDNNMALQGIPYSKAHAMYIQSHGSPLWQSPPRPVIEPAIEAHKEEVAVLLRSAISTYLESNGNSLEGFKKAGLYGASVSKDWFEDPRNNWPQNSPITIKEKGSDKPLIDTGSLRQSITYVIREGNK